MYIQYTKNVQSENKQDFGQFWTILDRSVSDRHAVTWLAAETAEVSHVTGQLICKHSAIFSGKMFKRISGSTIRYHVNRRYSV